MLFGNFAVVRTLMQPRTQMLGTSVAAEIGAIHDAYLRLPPAQRQPWVEQLVAASNGALVPDFPRPGTLRQPANAAQIESMQAIHKRLPGVVVGLSGGEEPQVWFALPGEGDDQLWLRIPVTSATDRSGAMMAIWGSGGVLVVLGGMVAIGWRQQRRVRGAGRALAQMEVSTAQAAPVLAVPTAGPPQDLPDVGSLEELVRVMSARMEQMRSRRDQALDAVAHELRAVLKYAPAEAVRSQRLAAFERLAGQFELFAQPQALEGQPVQQVDLNALVERKTREAPVGVTLGLAPVPPLSLRPEAMECLLDNLLRNALTHGGGQVVLTTAEEGDGVVLRVMDRGEPLADDEIAMLGRPFYRTEAARAQGVSAGLGLALARQIAQLHGGELNVRRREGGGLVVEVRLPLPQEESAALHRHRSPRRPMPAWAGLLADVALLAVLYVGALALGLSLLMRTVVEPNTAVSGRILQRMIEGVAAAYVTLPAQARPAYLQALHRHSGGTFDQAVPGPSEFREPLLAGVRTALEFLQKTLPQMEPAVSPLPNSALWFHLPAAEDGGPRPWLRLQVRFFSADLFVVLLGLVLLVGASAAFLAVRARGRLAWAARALREGDGDLQARARAHGENAALIESLMTVRQRFARACERLAQAKDEQELLLAHLLQDLGHGIDSLRKLGEQSPGLPVCADQLQLALEGLAPLARPAERQDHGVTHVNELLTALPIDAAVTERHPIRWSLGGVPFADLGNDEARRLFGAILNFLLAQEQQALEVSSAYENGWVVVRFTEQGGCTDPGAATQALLHPCQLAESRGGFMRFGRAPDQGGAQVEILLPPARLG